LDEPGRAFQVGDEISGHVEVSVNAACTCNGLSITQHWRTHGRGNTARGSDESQTLFNGDWSPGELHSYPFSFQAPPGPLTYHGHYLNVDWYLKAQADIPWALDPKAEAEYLLELGDADPRDLHQLTVPVGRGQHSGGPAFCMALFFAPFIVGGGAGFLGGVGMTLSGNAEGLFMMVWGFMFGGIPGLILLFMLRNTFAQRKLGPVELSFEPNRVQPGERARLRLGFQPRAEIKINTITATFKGQEVVVSGSGTNKTTHRHTLYEREHEITGECTLRRREHADFMVDFEVPDDAPWSFSASSNTLSWTCQVSIDIARWPDWNDEVPLVVIPPGPGAKA
jgi:hypothetical protein